MNVLELTDLLIFSTKCVTGLIKSPSPRNTICCSALLFFSVDSVKKFFFYFYSCGVYLSLDISTKFWWDRLMMWSATSYDSFFPSNIWNRRFWVRCQRAEGVSATRKHQDWSPKNDIYSRIKDFKRSNLPYALLKSTFRVKTKWEHSQILF